jgi:arylsulfatase
VHEGGIATPLVVHWPTGQLRTGSVVRTPFQLTDVMPTVLEATCAAYPARHNGRDIIPLEGRSVLPALRGASAPDGALFWEHTGNAAIRKGRWKLVRDHPKPWELYDLSRDRTELHDVAASHADVVAELAREWQAWADRVGVIPWEVTVDIYAARGQPLREAMG